jgi:hypothetical protein
MTAEKRSLRQISGNLQEFQAAASGLKGAVASSARVTRHSEVKVRVWMSTGRTRLYGHSNPGDNLA